MNLTNYYDPTTRKVFLSPTATLWTVFHEHAHAEQHAKTTFIYILWALFHQIRGIEYLVTILIEWDANRRARNAMIVNGIWTDEARQQARKNLLSYILRRSPDA